MEEQDIGKMYVNLALRRVMNIWHALFSKDFRRSRAFPLIVLLVALVIPAFFWVAHTHARIHKIREGFGDQAQQPVNLGPGGREPMLVSRNPGSAVPEFASATILPGLGMDVLQITASLPGHGQIPLLVAPSLQELSDGNLAHSGPNNLHGALEVPWGGLLSGLKNVLGTSLLMEWHGKSISVPTDDKGTPNASEGGMIQTRSADSASIAQVAGGTLFTGGFANTDFDGRWLSRTTVEVGVLVSATTLDLEISARNTGDDAEPMGIGWHPRFQLSGDRQNAQISLPEGESLEIVDHLHELPTGRFLPSESPLSTYINRSEPLRSNSLDGALVRFKGGAAPSAEFRNPAQGYGVRYTLLSSTIHELRIFAPADGDFVSFGAQTNFDNPLGRSWTEAEPGVVSLQPGQTLTFKVRLEIFPVARTGGH